MSLTSQEVDLINLVLEKYPPPQTFDLQESNRPELAEKIWSDLERRGYASISDTAVCVLSRIQGRFVSITEAGIEAVKLAKPE